MLSLYDIINIILFLLTQSLQFKHVLIVFLHCKDFFLQIKNETNHMNIVNILRTLSSLIGTGYSGK